MNLVFRVCTRNPASALATLHQLFWGNYFMLNIQSKFNFKWIWVYVGVKCIKLIQNHLDFLFFSRMRRAIQGNYWKPNVFSSFLSGPTTRPFSHAAELPAQPPWKVTGEPKPIMPFCFCGQPGLLPARMTPLWLPYGPSWWGRKGEPSFQALRDGPYTQLYSCWKRAETRSLHLHPQYLLPQQSPNHTFGVSSSVIRLLASLQLFYSRQADWSYRHRTQEP